MSLALHTYSYLSPGTRATGYRRGREVMRHLRMKQASPDDPKFLYQHWDPKTWTGYGDLHAKPVNGAQGWVWGKPEWAETLLYGYDALSSVGSSADSRGWTLYWTEGERDADSVTALGLPRVLAVSHHGGAGKATPAQVAYVRGWRGGVVVCLDEDDAGAACALGRYDALRRIGIPRDRLSIQRPAGPMAKNRDVSDHLQDEYVLSDLVPLNVPWLRGRVARMTPGQKRDGSGWWPAKTGDPELDNFDMSQWRPLSARAAENSTDQRGGGSPSRRRAAKQGGR